MGASGWDYGAPRPTTREQLEAVKEGDEFWEEGTHTILDMGRLVPADADDHDGTIRPLSPEEVQRYLGSARPTQEGFYRVYRQFGPIVDDIARWSGRYTILCDREHQIVFFGCSGD